ncbi:MAG: AAA family ATPase [Treponemataceae bacterium]|nr:AAA family ATPase [Treponemataceae bacterium]
MLVSFSCGNFLSYDSVQTLSLKAAKKLRTKKEHLFCSKTAGNVLKFAALYGANSAGKSNFFKAMNVVRSFILTGRLAPNSAELHCRIKRQNGRKPSFFEICFLMDGVPYTYGMNIDMQRKIVVSEWLFFTNGGEQQLLFKKEGADSGIEFGPELAGCKELQLLANVFSGGESPFLYCVNHNTKSFYDKNPEANILRTVFEWFALHFEVIYPEQPISDTALLGDSASLKEYADFLHMFGTGIVGIEKEEVSEDKVKSSISAADRANMEFRMNVVRMNNLLSKEKREWSAVIRNRTNIFTIKMDRSGSIRYYVLKFIHQYGDEKVAYEMRRESDGTYRLFQLLDVLMTAKDKVFVIDEISRCMHPLLTIKFVETFLRLAAERTVQLVVTTHETRLMKHEFLRRDEVWLCENDEGTSRLYSLDEKQVRIDKVMDENYMEGTFGGIPRLG